MPSNNTNIYQRAREAAGITQERAAENLGLSVESVKAYENSYRIPPNHAVASMIEIYGTTHLAYQHLRNSSIFGKDILPEISEKQLAESVVSFLASIPNIEHVQSSLIKIAADGVIGKDERTEFDTLMEKLNDMVKGIYTLKAHT